MCITSAPCHTNRCGNPGACPPRSCPWLRLRERERRLRLRLRHWLVLRLLRDPVRQEGQQP